MEKETGRDEKGRFSEGSEIGKETRFAKKNRAASKYRAEYADWLIEYFDTPLTRTEYRESLDGDGKVTKRVPVLLANEFPTFEGFAATLGVTTATLRNWCDKNKSFDAAYERAREMQKGRLISGTMCGLFNPLFAKFLAINNHGMSDKTVNDNTVKYEIGLPDEIAKEGD